jgi:hypothetical protein
MRVTGTGLGDLRLMHPLCDSEMLVRSLPPLTPGATGVALQPYDRDYPRGIWGLEKQLSYCCVIALPCFICD